MDENVFEKDGIYYKISESNTEVSVVESPKKYMGDIVLPSTVEYNGNKYKVTAIGRSAFSGCSSLESIDLGNITTIEDSAFWNCSSLQSIDFKNVTSIGDRAFVDCYSLTSLDFGNVKRIGSNSFSSCSSLTTLDLKNVDYIEANAFYDCESVTSIDFRNVQYIGMYAFMNCTSLRSIEINNVYTIDEGAFWCCNTLRSIDLKNVEIIKENSFYFCTSLQSLVVQNVSSIRETAFLDCSSLKSIVLKNVSNIENKAFDGCRSITSIDLNNVDTIGNEAFSHCEFVTSIDFKGVSTIRQRAFCFFKSLKSINLRNIDLIEECAFWFCNSLTEIRVSNMHPQSIDKNCFENSHFKNATLYVPNGSKYRYMKHKVWGMFDKIVEYQTSEHPLYLTLQHSDSGNVTMEVEKGWKYNLVINASENRKIKSVTFNGSDVTAQMYENNRFTTPEIEENSILNVSLESINGVSTEKETEVVFVRTINNQICLDGVPEGEAVKVCTEDGAMVAYMVSNGDSMIIGVKPGKEYQVNVLNRTFKVPM